MPSPEDDPSRGVAVDRWPLPLPVPHSARVAGSPPRGTSVLPPLYETTRAPTISSISGLNHAASELAVYASQSASRRPTQDSLAAGGQPLAARDWLPAGLIRSFFHLHGFLFSRLCLAQFVHERAHVAREAPLFVHEQPEPPAIHPRRLRGGTASGILQS